MLDPIPTFQQLATAVNDGLITCRTQGSLGIYNYTARCQYEGLWSPVTRQCRGLVLDTDTGEVVARPWSKFYNLGEPHAPEAPPSDRNREGLVTEKMDGALGILYRQGRDIRWATRGSFDSPQAQAANALWKAHHAHVAVPEAWTLLTEIIHPTSRVVVRYAHQGLTVLGARDRFTGEEVPWAEVADFACEFGLPLTGHRRLHSLAELVEQAGALSDQEEGWVVRWDRPGREALRLKIKGDAYRAVHRLLQGMTDRRVADLWYAERRDLVAALPGHEQARVRALWTLLDAAEAYVRESLALAAQDLQERLGERPSRKDFAITAKQRHGDLFGLLMAQHLGRPVDVRAHVYREEHGATPRPCGVAS